MQNPLRGPRLWNVQTPGLNFSYCHIPKTGSNIWRKRIRAILSGIDVNYDESKDEDQVEEGPTQLDEVGRKRPKWMRQLDFPVEWNMQERLDAFLVKMSIYTSKKVLL